MSNKPLTQENAERLAYIVNTLDTLALGLSYNESKELARAKWILKEAASRVYAPVWERHKALEAKRDAEVDACWLGVGRVR